MLKGIDPLLTPDLLSTCAPWAMANGSPWWTPTTADWLAAGKPVVRLPGHSLERVAQAVLSVFPLAVDVAQPAGYMQHSRLPAGQTTEAQAPSCAWSARPRDLPRAGRGDRALRLYDRRARRQPDRAERRGHGFRQCDTLQGRDPALNASTANRPCPTPPLPLPARRDHTCCRPDLPDAGLQPARHAAVQRAHRAAGDQAASPSRRPSSPA